ncbi:MAG: histone deacetylase [Pseudomonadota bacterium]
MRLARAARAVYGADVPPPIVHHPDYEAQIAPGHRFPMAKYRHLRAALARRGLITPGEGPAPGAASAALLSLAHDPGYVSRAFALALTDAEQRRIGLPRHPAMLRRARLAAAGTVMTAEYALSAGIACNTAGGSHHARWAGGAGFSTFNDVAIAARALLAAGRIRRALVVDCDVHQGDGTAEIFAADERVFTVSLHAAKNFPLRKEASDLDVALPDGLEDAGYLDALDQALDAALAAGPFDLAFYNAGVDVHREDRLGRLALTDDGIAARDALVLSRLRDADFPVAAVIGGGYGADAAIIAERHALLFEAAAARWAAERSGPAPHGGAHAAALARSTP